MRLSLLILMFTASLPVLATTNTLQQYNWEANDEEEGTTINTLVDWSDFINNVDLSARTDVSLNSDADFGRVLAFNALGAAIDLPFTTAMTQLGASNTYAWALAIKPANTALSGLLFSSKFSVADSSEPHLIVVELENGYLQVSLFIGDELDLATRMAMDQVLSASDWNHLVISITDNRIRAYVNSVQQNLQALSGTRTASDMPLHSSRLHASNLNLEMDYFEMHNRELFHFEMACLEKGYPYCVDYHASGFTEGAPGASGAYVEFQVDQQADSNGIIQKEMLQFRRHGDTVGEWQDLADLKGDAGDKQDGATIETVTLTSDGKLRLTLSDNRMLTTATAVQGSISAQNGANGTGISSIAMAGNNLMITKTDSATIDAGRVKGDSQAVSCSGIPGTDGSVINDIRFNDNDQIEYRFEGASQYQLLRDTSNTAVSFKGASGQNSAAQASISCNGEDGEDGSPLSINAGVSGRTLTVTSDGQTQTLQLDDVPGDAGRDLNELIYFGSAPVDVANCNIIGLLSPMVICKR